MMKKPWYKRVIANRPTLVLGVFIIVIIAVLLINQRAITVQVATPERDAAITVFGLGTVEARLLSDIGFEVGATLIDLTVDHGDVVSKDAVVARLRDGEQTARIILADEPTAALDSERAGIVMDLLRMVAAEQQAAILAVTHDEKIYDRLDRAFDLRDGRLGKDYEPNVGGIA